MLSIRRIARLLLAFWIVAPAFLLLAWGGGGFAFFPDVLGGHSSLASAISAITGLLGAMIVALWTEFAAFGMRRSDTDFLTGREITCPLSAAPAELSIAISGRCGFLERMAFRRGQSQARGVQNVAARPVLRSICRFTEEEPAFPRRP